MHVDYLSVSFKDLQIGEGGGSLPPHKVMLELFSTAYSDAQEGYPREFYYGTPQPPFNRGMNTPFGNLYWHSRKAGALLQMGGNACQLVGADWIMWACAECRITRIDIAHDIDNLGGQLTPDIVCADADARTSARNVSDTGLTLYFGSPKSDVRSRIYEYYAPHPRAGKIRIEHVFRRGAALSAARAVAEGKMSAAYAMRCAALKLKYAEHDHNAPHLTIAPRVISNDDGKKIAWLKKSVSGTLNRLLRSGVLRLEEVVDAENLGLTFERIFSETPTR